MCGRFTQQFTWEEIYEAYNLVVPGIPNLRPNWNVAPTQDVGVVLPEGDHLTFKPMRWGLVPGWAKDTKIGYSLINARVESAAEKPSFRSAWKSRRCLIPASGWFEWKTVPPEGNGKPAKQPYYMRMARHWRSPGYGSAGDQIICSPAPSLPRTRPKVCAVSTTGCLSCFLAMP